MAKRQTNARKVVYDGIQFRSMLERNMYKLLKEAGIPFSYEEQRFEIDSGFISPHDSYERFMNGKGVFMNRGGKVYKSSIYTPDFLPPVGEPLKWVIEIKGRSFPDFSRTWRAFKKMLLKKDLNPVCFVPRDLQDCKETIKIIKTL